MDELFAERAVFADKEKQRIGYVLLSGEAGTGKSTLVRKLANIWARGRGFREVLLVYVLFVSKIRASQFNNEKDNCFRAETLATAVVWELISQLRRD